MKKPVAKSSSKRIRTISSEEGDTQKELKPVKKKQMKQGSILDMMSKCKFLIKKIIFYNFSSGKKKVVSDSEDSPVKKKKTIDLSDSEEIDSDVPAPKTFSGQKIQQTVDVNNIEIPSPISDEENTNEEYDVDEENLLFNEIFNDFLSENDFSPFETT